MVIVIINLRGLFMSVAYKKRKKRKGGEKTIGEGAMGEKKIGKKGKDFIPRVSRKVQRITCVNQSTDDR